MCYAYALKDNDNIRFNLTYLRPSITQGGVCIRVYLYEHLSYPAPPVLQSCFLSAGSGWCLGLSWEVVGLINYQKEQGMRYLNFAGFSNA